ncbi:MAG: TraR/DksA family transcriptional regulator [Syntrophobacteraceae bacterium]
MDENTLVVFNGILVARLQQLQHGLRYRLSAEEDSSAAGPMDEMDLITERCQREYHLLMRQRNSRTAREIVDALNRLGAGLFGICEECGAQIELGRLKVQPTASVCIDCKKELEAEERKKSRAC